MTTGIKGSKTIHTLEDCIRDIGEIPFCQCGCGNKVNIDPKYYLRYKKLGYPKFIRGHKTHGISWKLSEENKIPLIYHNLYSFYQQGTPAKTKEDRNTGGLFADDESMASSSIRLLPSHAFCCSFNFY